MRIYYSRYKKRITQFNNILSNILNKFKTHHHSIIVLDLNIIFPNSNNYEDKFCNLYYGSSFLPLIIILIRISQNFISCINYIWCRQFTPIQLCVIASPINNYFLIYALFPLNFKLINPLSNCSYTIVYPYYKNFVIRFNNL